MLEITKTLPCQSSMASNDAAVKIDQYSHGIIWVTVTQTHPDGPRESEPIKLRLNELLMALAEFKL